MPCARRSARLRTVKFAIYGAGAVGGLLGTRLLEGGHDVHFIARGANLDAQREQGLLIRSEVFGEKRYRVHATSSATEVGPSDFVILAVKASSLTQIAPLVEPLKGADTTFVSTQNGLPWWYFYGVPGDDAPIECVDPGGVVAKHIPAPLVLGAIVYISSSMAGPGIVTHSSGVRLPLGEPSGERSERIRMLSSALREVGIKAPLRNDIRHELWVKLMGNAAFNPLSALTRNTLAELTDSPQGLRLIEAIMDEVRQVASAVGVQIALSNERRIAGGRAAGSHKPSMLQDLEQGRAAELDALLGAVLELADRYHVSTPTLRVIDTASRLLFQRASEQVA